MSNQLLSCPFCGHDGAAKVSDRVSAWVQCTNAKCGARGPISNDPSLAATAWNNRAAPFPAGNPVYQWGHKGVWSDCKEAEQVSARTNGFKTRTLWTAPPAAAPVAAVEPAAMQARMPGCRWENYHKDDKAELLAAGMEIRWLYAEAPPAAAHGDDAVRKDAQRYRWLCDGNGYFMEENDLCGHFNEKQEADAAIDAAMRAQGDGEVQP